MSTLVDIQDKLTEAQDLCQLVMMAASALQSNHENAIGRGACRVNELIMEVDQMLETAKLNMNAWTGGEA